MQFLASFPIAFTLAILANGLLASLIKERCAHDLSHCTVSADGVMYAALFLMVLGLATWNVHVLGRGCLVAALAFMLACAVASVSMSIDVLSEQHMELARSPFFLLFGVFVFIGWVTGHGAKEAQGAGAAETLPTVVDEQAPLLSQPISCVLRSAKRRASREAQRRFELAGICRLLCKYPGVLESVAVAQPHRWWRRAPCPPSPPPSPASPLSLQLMLAGQILVEALNGSDESTKDELLRLIESCGYTVRSDEEEAALRQLVNLADVNSAAALGEPPSLDDAAMWADACFMQLREQSRMEVSAEEICEFLGAMRTRTRLVAETMQRPRASRASHFLPRRPSRAVMARWPSSMLRLLTLIRASRTCSMPSACRTRGRSSASTTPSWASSRMRMKACAIALAARMGRPGRGAWPFRIGTARRLRRLLPGTGSRRAKTWKCSRDDASSSTMAHASSMARLVQDIDHSGARSNKRSANLW